MENLTKRLLDNEKVAVLFLVILAAFLFFFRISSMPILDGDTAFYAKIAKNIVTGGDFLTLRLTNTGEILDKVPLVPWMIAISYKVLGINEFALRLWHSLMAIGVVLLTYFIGRLLTEKKTAFLSSLVLITSAQFFYQAREPLQDIPMTFFMLAALFCFLLFDQSRKHLYFYLTAACMALAVLAKGPVGFILPALIIFFYLLCSRRLFKYEPIDYLIHLPLAVILMLIMVVPWFYAEYQVLGQPFIDIMQSHHLGRFWGPIDTVGKMSIDAPLSPQYNFYQYFMEIFVLILPWSAFMYPALIYCIKNRKQPGISFVIVWAAVVVLFFSFSLNYKISRYILPAFPALSIMIGKLWNDFTEGRINFRPYMLASGIINIALILPVFILASLWLLMSFPATAEGFKPILVPFIIVFTIGLLISTVHLFIRQNKFSFLAFVLTAIIAYGMIISLADRHFDNAKPFRSFGQEINKLGKPNDKAARFLGRETHTLIFYADREVDRVNSNKELYDYLSQNPSAFVFTEDEDALADFQNKYPYVKIKIIDKKNNYILFKKGN